MDDAPQSASPGVSPRPRRGYTSVAFAIGLALVGFLLVSAARQTKPGPRSSRKGRLVDLIALQQTRNASMRQALDALQRQLAALEGNAAGREKRIAAIEAQADALAPFAGFAPVKGPGLQVRLMDSTLRDSPTGDPNDLVIHQQDIQAVVNAMWDGGAEAIAINGQRITALTAVRCVGNTLLLHGQVYSPPYVVAAIGSAAAINDAFDRSDGVDTLRVLAQKYKLGFDVDTKDEIALPGLSAPAPLRYAQPGAASRTRR